MAQTMQRPAPSPPAGRLASSALLERLYGIRQKPVGSCLAMPERTFAQVEAELRNVLTRLKPTTDPKVRRELLHEMRRLLAEAERCTAEAERTQPRQR
jgi:hypothetical protein